MKKHILTAFSIITCMTAGGCSLGEIAGLPPEPQIKSGYSCEYTASAVIIPPDTCEETEFTFGGKLKRLGMGFWENELTSPDTLSGLKICCEDDNVSTSLGELSFDMGAAEIPDASPFMAIFETLDKAAVSENSLQSVSEGGWKLEAENAVITFDGSGIPVKIEISEPKVTVEISAFEQSGATTENASETTASEQTEETTQS